MIFFDELFVKFGRLVNKWNKMLFEVFNCFYNVLWYYFVKFLIILVCLIFELSDCNGYMVRLFVYDLLLSYF